MLAIIIIGIIVVIGVAAVTIYFIIKEEEPTKLCSSFPNASSTINTINEYIVGKDGNTNCYCNEDYIYSHKLQKCLSFKEAIDTLTAISECTGSTGAYRYTGASGASGASGSSGYPCCSQGLKYDPVTKKCVFKTINDYHDIAVTPINNPLNIIPYNLIKLDPVTNKLSSDKTIYTCRAGYKYDKIIDDCIPKNELDYSSQLAGTGSTGINYFRLNNIPYHCNDKLVYNTNSDKCI
jgi:hypothetical protein